MRVRLTKAPCAQASIAGRARACRGVSLVEMLMALAIGAILMLALAGGVKAISDSYLGNTGRNTAVQAARRAVYKICSSVRQSVGGTVATSSALFVKTSIIPERYDVYLLDGKYLRYYQGYSGGPSMPLSAGTTGNVLARDVSSLAFAGKTDVGGNLIGVEVRMTVSPRNGSFTLSDSAIVRKSRVVPDPTKPFASSNPAPL